MDKVIPIAILLLLFASGCSGKSQTEVQGAKGGEAVAAPAPSRPTVARQGAQPESLSLSDLLTRLEVQGLQAQATGETVPPILGATRGELLLAEGMPVQVYLFTSADAASNAFRQAHTLSWSAEPHFVRTGNLFITIVSDDRAKAVRIMEALR